MIPLEGVRIISLERAQQLPYATVMLSDFGAEVIRVEPRGGETTRGMHRVGGRYLTLEEKDKLPSKLHLNPYLMAHARNKKSIALDLNSEKGREIVYKLAKTAQVFMQNSRLPWIRKAGYDYETIKKYNPEIVYVTGSGFGDKGPLANAPANDIIGQAMGGITSMVGMPGTNPMPVGTTMAEQVTAIYTAFGTMAALMAKERFGVGQEVNVSLLGAQLALAAWDIDTLTLHGEMGHKSGRGYPLSGGLWGMYPCKDDRWIALAGVQDARWPAFCQALGMEEVEKDPRFATGIERMESHREELVALVSEKFRSKTRDEWVKTLREYDIIVGPVCTYEDFLNSSEVAQQVKANDYIVDLDVPGVGTVQVVGIPAKLSQTPGKVQRTYPELGEHTNELLLELGYSWDDIAQLIAEGII